MTKLQANKECYQDFYSRRQLPFSYDELRNSQEIVKAVKKLGLDLKGKRVLEVGFGAGLSLIALAKWGADCFGVEIVDEALATASELAKQEKVSEKLKLFTADAESLPFEDKKFDLIIFSHVLGSLDHPEKALKEAERTMKEEGYMLILFPNQRFKSTVKGLYESFSESFLLELAEKHGFSCTLKRNYKSSFDFSVIKAMQLFAGKKSLSATVPEEVKPSKSLASAVRVAARLSFIDRLTTFAFNGRESVFAFKKTETFLKDKVVFRPFKLDHFTDPINTTHRELALHSKYRSLGFSSAPFDDDKIETLDIYSGPAALKPFKALAAAFNKIDLMHSGPRLEHVFMYWLAKLRNPRMKHIHTVHSTHRFRWNNFFECLLYLIISYLSRHADLVVANSRFTQKEFQEIYGLGSKVIYNGIDTSYFTPRKKEAGFLARHDLASPSILYAGSLIPRKRVDLFLAVAKKLPQCNFVLVGDGPLRKTVEKAIAQKNLNHLLWLKRVGRKEMAEWFANADCLLFPSEEEPFGKVTAEAMASGIPVIGVRSGAFPELVEDGESGLIAEPGNAESLARLAEFLVHNPAKAKKIGLTARKKALACFNKGIACRNYEEIYDCLLDSQCK